ncbi:hypothetical protein [Arenimonas sp. MALMAid1274]|uniref:hypothetical protein n=1 Tax=Arenimonas sp. MALMAid1274 TaxID=3411630 RepID=UPI003B9E351E
MIFLLEYNQALGKLEKIETFDDANREQANCRRTLLELELLRAGINNEIVILDAQVLADLQRSHGRYFRAIENLPDGWLESIGFAKA